MVFKIFLTHADTSGFNTDIQSEGRDAVSRSSELGEQLVSSSENNISKVYTALGNSYRRQIVQILREKGKAGFKELHDTLGISVGALYHHLEALEGIVAQAPDKKYVLTEQGRSTIDTLSISEEKIAAGRLPVARETRLGLVSKEVLFGRTLFEYLNQESLRTLPLAVLIVFFGGWVSSQANLEPLLLFYLSPTSSAGRAWFILLFPIGWLATFAVADILSTTIFHRKGGDISLLNGTAFSMLPLLIVPGISFLVQEFSPGRPVGYLTILLPVVLQVWILCLLSTSISISKGLKLEKTALISLGVVYVNILALVTALQFGLF